MYLIIGFSCLSDEEKALIEWKEATVLDGLNIHDKVVELAASDVGDPNDIPKGMEPMVAALMTKEPMMQEIGEAIYRDTGALVKLGVVRERKMKLGDRALLVTGPSKDAVVFVGHMTSRYIGTGPGPHIAWKLARGEDGAVCEEIKPPHVVHARLSFDGKPLYL